MVQVSLTSWHARYWMYVGIIFFRQVLLFIEPLGRSAFVYFRFAPLRFGSGDRFSTLTIACGQVSILSRSWCDISLRTLLFKRWLPLTGLDIAASRSTASSSSKNPEVVRSWFSDLRFFFSGWRRVLDNNSAFRTTAEVDDVVRLDDGMDDFDEPA